MKRVLVTGASGFIGRNTLDPLVARGYEVHAVARSRGEGEQCAWHEVDLFDGPGVQQLIERIRPTHLLHLAWYVEHGEFWTSAENLHWVGASLELVNAFAEAGGRRAVSVGTSAEYEWGGDAPCTEGRTPLRPATLYGASKLALNIASAAYARQRGISAAWGRVFHLYGPEETRTRLIPSTITALLAGEVARCTSGEQLRDLMHVGDVADALVALLDSDVTGDVNIASGAPVRLRDAVREIARQLDAEHLVHLGALPVSASDPSMLTASVRRLRDEVGWTPRCNLQRGLADTIAWWRGVEALSLRSRASE